MGAVFGAVREELPRHTTVISTDAFVVRRYAPSVAAVSHYGAGGWGEASDGSPFGALARYIGVFSTPENSAAGSAPERIAMTAPVLIDTSTDPERHAMMFVLPGSVYGSDVARVPTPTNQKVSIKEMPERLVAVRTFSGVIRHKPAAENLALLLADVEADGRYDVVRAADGSPRWQAAGYNSPFVLPWLRTNEVLLEVVEGKK